MNSDETGSVTIDTTGMRCPMPLLKLKQALNTIRAGECIQLVSTDAGSQRDIPAFIAMTNHELKQQCEREGEYRFWVIKGDAV
ncbi:sulfurtransferase TusA family protein [Reinekea marinisedimentorum]|nr:sulfurtransferase TusA family protein [Reinekea marinisedimentorum]